MIYGYDANGRLNMAVADAGTVGTDTYTYTSGTNQLATLTTSAGTRTVSYDGRGNTSGETRPGSVTVTTGYDGYARLTSYVRSGGQSLAFDYNGLDDRVTMVLGSDTRRFVYDVGGRVLGEYGADASDVKAEFIWMSPEVGAGGSFGGDDGLGGYMPLAVATPDLLGAVQLGWVHGNHLGVPLVITDSGGSLATTPNDYLAPGFPGQSKVLPDLFYNRYRDYDPVTGRYVQADPIGLGGGSNIYLYAGANPVNELDPEGLSPEDWLPAMQFAGIVMAGDALGAVNARNAGKLYCIDPWDVGIGIGVGVVTGYGIGKLGGLLWRGSKPPVPNEIPPLNLAKQGKHIPEHPGYIPGRSPLTHPDPRKLIDQFAGKGQPVGRVPRGQAGFKERVNFGQVIGEFEGQPTTNGIIHYAKDGVHIVPARP